MHSCLKPRGPMNFMLITDKMSNLPNDEIVDSLSECPKKLTPEEQAALERQETRLVSAFQANKLEVEAKKFWDKFYKRNGNRFFKDRNWTTREFNELITKDHNEKTLLEVGCGVGNFLFPLLDNGFCGFIHACDLSPKAVELVQQNEKYSSERVNAFAADVTADAFKDNLEPNVIDFATLIFVLSAIHPDKHKKVVENILHVLKPGGVVLFRDYGLYDMTQLRFKPGHKISANFYSRQDGTRSYFFSTEELGKLFSENGFEILSNSFVHRRTVNVKENINVPRIFVQAKFRKSLPM